MENYNDYLVHYGVKGQKWGVRRFQNPDGTLTDKGKKRLTKNEAYRDKLVKKAQRKADKKTSEAKEAEYNIKDLKKRGTKSQAYREWKEGKDREREYAYEREHRIENDKGDVYVKKYNMSGTRLMNDIVDRIGANETVEKLIDENYTTARRSREAAKKWMQNKNDLMNMNVDALTSRRDIRKTYRG